MGQNLGEVGELIVYITFLFRVLLIFHAGQQAKNPAKGLCRGLLTKGREISRDTGRIQRKT